MAKIIHPNEPKYIIELIKTYTDAQAKLISIVSQKHARKTNTVYQKRIMARINDTLRAVIRDSELWTNANIPRQYKKAVN